MYLFEIKIYKDEMWNECNYNSRYRLIDTFSYYILLDLVNWCKYKSEEATFQHKDWYQINNFTLCQNYFSHQWGVWNNFMNYFVFVYMNKLLTSILFIYLIKQRFV